MLIILERMPLLRGLRYIAHLQRVWLGQLGHGDKIVDGGESGTCSQHCVLGELQLHAPMSVLVMFPGARHLPAAWYGAELTDRTASKRAGWVDPCLI